MLIHLIILLFTILNTSTAEYDSYDDQEHVYESRSESTFPFSHLIPSISVLRVRKHKARPFAPASPNKVTKDVITLITRPGASLSRQYLQALHSQNTKRSIETTSPIIEVSNGNVYLTPVKFGKQSFLSVLDTGSSDTWLIGRNFTCHSVMQRKPMAQKDCRFGPSFNTSASSSFKQFSDQHFNISYADGEFLNGIMGSEDVTLAGLTVPQQTVGVVDYAAWMGDTKSSGLIGLAYPNVTRAYPGNNAKTDRRGGNIPYSPLFTTMWKSNLTAPLFSLALARNAKEDGVLALGGLPGPPVRYSTTFARTAIEYMTITSETGNETVRASEYQMYTISVENFSFSKAASRFVLTPPKIETMKPTTQFIIDSGTTLIFLNPNLTASINALFSPKATYNSAAQTYFVGCTAAAPRVGLTIGGTTFWLDPKDMIQDAGVGTGLCISGIQPGGGEVGIVGDVWLKSVLAVFDVGAGEMRFAVRY